MRHNKRIACPWSVLVLIPILISGCSVRRAVVNRIGDAMTSGSSVFETEGDLELNRAALPFSLKLLEMMIGESPRHHGLLLSACQGYTLYSNAWIDFEAQVAYDVDLERSRELRDRAYSIYGRALSYCFRAIERFYPGFEQELARDPDASVQRFRDDKKQRDVPALYWTAASLALMISAGRDDAAMLARLPEAQALSRRALELDESWNQGALHELQAQLSSGDVGERDSSAFERHWQRAAELSAGNNLGLGVLYAESIAVPSQDREAFVTRLRQVLDFDLDDDPARRLVNALAQRRARWLLSRIDDLILEE